MTLPATRKTPLERAKETHQKRTSHPELKLTAAFMQDDYFAEGLGWVGPMPQADGKDATQATRLSAEIKRAFVSRDMLGGVVTRHVDGIAGREPLWSITPITPGSDEQADRQRAQPLTDAFRDWWDNSGVWLSIQQALKTAVWSGKGTVRLFIPRSKLKDIPQEDGTTRPGVPARLSLADALRFISVHAPEWDQAGLMRDTDRRVTGAYYKYTSEEGQERWEIQERVDGQTVITPDAALPEVTDEYPVSDLLIFELSREPLIRKSLRSLNATLNKIWTMGSRNIDLGGFVERTILNAQMPGEWVDDKTAPGGKRFIVKPLHLGAGTVNAFNGTAIMEKNELGEWKPTGNFATPNLIYKDPVPWDTFGAALAEVREAIFDEAKQLHVLITGDASASGVSRQQAVNDFLSSLEPTRIILEQLIRWLITTVLKLGLHFTGQPDAFQTFKATAQARTSAIQPTPAEVDTARALRREGLISLKTFYARIGLEETEAELTALSTESITPDLALTIIGSNLPTFVGLRAAKLAFPALNIQDSDIEAQRELDLAAPAPATDPGALNDPANEPNTDPDQAAD